MERSAFVRARGFLNYHPVAKWSALVAGVATAVLYVLLLIVLGLFTDLMVNQGEITVYANLLLRERALFDQTIAAAEEDRKFSPKEDSLRFKDLGIDSKESLKSAQRLLATDPQK